jgi:hypothetical protein
MQHIGSYRKEQNMTKLNGPELEAVLLTGMRNLLLDKKVSFLDEDGDTVEGIVELVRVGPSGIFLDIQDGNTEIIPWASIQDDSWEIRAE